MGCDEIESLPFLRIGDGGDGLSSCQSGMAGGFSLRHTAAILTKTPSGGFLIELFQGRAL